MTVHGVLRLSVVCESCDDANDALGELHKYNPFPWLSFEFPVDKQECEK